MLGLIVDMEVATTNTTFLATYQDTHCYNNSFRDS